MCICYLDVCKTVYVKKNFCSHFLFVSMALSLCCFKGEGWSSQNVCLWKELSSLSWSAARTQCMTHGADLAWIDDGRDFSDIMDKT